MASLQKPPSLFVALLLFVLTVFLPSTRAAYSALPVDFLPPSCSSNITKYGPLVQALKSISLQVQYCISVETSLNHYTEDCTSINSTYLPVVDHQLDPAVGTYFSEIFRYEPEDIWGLSGRTTLNFNLSYAPPGMSGVSLALGKVDTTSSSLDIEWDTFPSLWNGLTMYSYFAEFYQDSTSLIPDPLEEIKPVYSYSYVVLAPQVAVSSWSYEPLWNQSCSIAFNTVIRCCINEQPPLLVLQPYWILLLSTCAYFAASYAYVYLLINLERLACWRRGTKKLGEYVDLAPIKLRAWASTFSSASDNGAVAVSTRDGRSPGVKPTFEISSHSLEHSTSPPRARKEELKVVDANLRRSFRDDFLEPLVDPSDQQDFVDSAATDEEAKEATANSVVDANPANGEVIQAQPSTIKNSAPLHDSSGFESLTPLTISERLTSANSSYLLLQLLIVCCNFLYIIVRLTALDRSPKDASNSAWWRYQEVYMFWTNSSMVTLLASALASHVFLKYQFYKTLQFHRSATEIDDEQATAERESCRKCYTCGCCCMFCRSKWVRFKLFYKVQLPKEKLVCRHIACAVLALFSPAICTHVIPMWLLFFPFLLLAFAILLILMAIVFGVFYLTEISADRAYGNLKEMYDKRINSKEAPAVDQSDESAKADAISPPSATKEEAAVSEATSTSSRAALNRVPPVVFPWYAILLLRLLFTITIVVLFQTSFNYGQIIYTYIWPIRDEIDGSIMLFLWGEPSVFEFVKRDTNIWYESMQMNLHQFLTQLSLFL